MATRISIFLEEGHDSLELPEDMDSKSRDSASNTHLSVFQGINENHAEMEIHCEETAIILKLSLRDLCQEKHPLLFALKESVITDIDHDSFDYFDQIPPFGVIELYALRLKRNKKTTETDVEAVFRQLQRFLLHHFIMVVFMESELGGIPSTRLLSPVCAIRSFKDQERQGYRISSYG
ncbi:hypothetical protein [Paenibacillus sp. YIM B09110]|uniref:hypothetical protein n=1 Tax=Paenibacillus sp. YIM B09110 TaxID=3126102 RepID=UPI00301DF84A